MQAVGFTSVCSTWCRGRGQSGAVISWYAAVRNEARARRMMLRGDDFWQFASNTGRLVEHYLDYLFYSFSLSLSLSLSLNCA